MSVLILNKLSTKKTVVQKKVKIAVTAILVYLLMWAITAIVGGKQCESRVTLRIKEIAEEKNLGNIEPYETLEELLQDRKNEGFGYYYRAYSYAPFWIRFEVAAEYSPFEKHDVAWLFGIILGFPEKERNQPL